MRPTRLRTITSLLATVGAGYAVSAMIGAPIAVAEFCQPGHVGIDGQCTFSDVNTSEVPAPPDGTGKSGTPGTLLCTQSGHCTYFEGG
jgi:hypothetical protein